MGEKGTVPKKDMPAFKEAVKDVLKAIGGVVGEAGTKLISVPILLCPTGTLFPMETEDGRLGA